jgi:hypothetical protein
MTINRLAKSDAPPIVAPKGEADRQAFWIERGNRVLWGQEPTTKGEFYEPRHDLRWACKNGNYFLEPRSGAKA